MKLVFEKPIQAGAFFTKDGSKPFELILGADEEGIVIVMSNDDAKEIMNCLQESFSEEST